MMRRWDYCCGSGDPAIKLFGKRIPLAPMRNDRQQTGMEGVDESRTTSDRDELDHNEPSAAIVLDDEEEEEQEEQEEVEELDRAGTNFDEDEGDCCKGASSPGSTTKFDKEDQSDNNNDGKDPNSKPKKPDKPVACPRCDSMETKFCYYNNYNINQPRHFCKNCQRYWTSGGTLRNVPVGAGRRKNKHHHHHHHQNSTPPQQQWRQHHQQHQQQHQDPHQQAAAVAMNNFTVKMMQQRYGIQEDEPSSIITSLGASGGIPPRGTKNVNNDFCFGFPFGQQQQQQQQNQKPHCSQSSNNSEVTVCGGSSSPTSLQDLSSGNSKLKNPSGKSDDASATAAAAAAAAAAWVFPMGMLGKNVPPAVFPYTHPPGGGIPIWPGSVPPAVAAAAAGQWSMQWAAVAAMAAAANASVNNAAAVAAAASGMSPRGKRPGEAADHGGVWVPKTLRIDDPGDAARSSIWAALGVDRKRDSGIHHDSQQQKIGTINPAAMARSTSFRESC